MVERTLKETTLELLAAILPGELDADERVRQLLEAELGRKLGYSRRTDNALAQKYGMSFVTFLSDGEVQRRDYSWEVERDAMEWETAIGGIEMLEVRLQELRQDAAVDTSGSARPASGCTK